MSTTKKLKSPKGNIRVALLSGHVTTIEEEPSEVSSVFWSEAYSLGAVDADVDSNISDDFVSEQKASLHKEEEDKLNKLQEFLVTVFEEPRDFLDKSNKPYIRKLSAALGFPVNKDIVIEEWSKLQDIKG